MEERTELPMLYGKSSTTPSPRSLGVLGIFREAFSVFAANGKVMASIILLVIIPYQILAVVEKLTFTPLAKDLLSKLTLLNEHPIDSPLGAKLLDELKHDSRVLLGVKTIFLLILIILALFSLAAAASASTMSYSRKKFSLMQLLLKVKGTWKKPVVTWFYILLLAVAYGVLALLLFGIVAVTTHGRWFILLSTAMLLFAVLASVYLAAVWTLALVVSVNEEDTCGMKAITRAEELIKGRKIQGFLLKFLLSITAGLGIILLSCMRVGVLKYSGGLPSIASVVGICLIALLKFFTFVVVTVFYHECKKDEVDKSGEEKMAKLGFVYSSVPCGDA